MSFRDYLEAQKIAKERKLAKSKAKALNSTSRLISTYAENAVNKFKSEYFVQSNIGKRSCVIHINPFPDAEIMKTVLNKINKKEYLAEFERVFAEKLEQQGFTHYTLTDNFFNSKEPITIKISW